MDIEYWESRPQLPSTRNRSIFLRAKALSDLVHEWEKLDTGLFKIKRIVPEEGYLSDLRKLTNNFHDYVSIMRTIVKINGKYIFLDSTDRPILAAESWKLPFDLIVKFQHDSNFDTYKKAIAPVVPFTYTMSWYDLDLVNKCWEKRKEVLRSKKFTSSMFWAGKIINNSKQRRVVMQYLERMKHATCKKRMYEEYFSEMATTQVGIAVAGTGDFTHRDIELMSVGNAFFRKTFQNITRNLRVPGVHYYSIGGHEAGINKTMSHFCDYFEPSGEYRDFSNEEWEQHCEMSYNAKRWWNENGSSEGTFNLFREILEENNIV